MEFENIILTDSQYELLKAAENNHIAITKDNRNDCFYLRDLGFVEIYALAKQSLAPADAIGKVKTGAINTPKGIAYLRWREEKERKDREIISQRKSDRIHDYKVVAFGAVCGSLITLLIQNAASLFSALLLKLNDLLNLFR